MPNYGGYTGIMGAPRPAGVTPIKTRYAKRHYEQIAGVIGKYVGDASTRPGAEAIANDLTHIFENDNPRFNKELFLKACGLR